MILMVIDWTWNKWIFEKSLMAWRQLVWRAMILMVHCSDELFVTRYNVKCYCYCFFIIAIVVLLFCSVLFCFAIVRAFCYFIASPHPCTPVGVRILPNKHCSTRNSWGSFDCAYQLYTDYWWLVISINKYFPFLISLYKVSFPFVTNWHIYFLSYLLTKLCHLKSLGQCKKDVTHLLTHWSYIFLALTHW